MKKIYTFILLVFICSASFAQQDSQYTHYMYNTININPAYAGNRGALSIFGLHRTQWMGLEGAPTTYAASINSPIENSKLGYGLSLVNDKIGAGNQSNIAVDISYTIMISEEFDLSFGIKGSVDLLNVDYTKLNRYNVNNPIFQNNIDNEFSPNVGAGLFFFSEKMYLGVSVPYFLATKHFDDNTSGIEIDRLHYYFIGGYVFDLSSNVKLKPSFLTKVVAGAPLQVDLSANVLFSEKFTLGLAYRVDAAATAMTGFQINKNWFIGYSYDFETTKLNNYNSGSHELFLRYELPKINRRTITPRFF